VIESLSWSGTPQLIVEYLAPGPNRGRFPFFPCAAYVGFGLAAGAIVKRTAAEQMDRLMQWCALIGFATIFTAQYFANIPFSLYATPDFWRSSPSLILIRTGISLAMLASAYLWTEYVAAARWSWMQALGQTSLLVYWVHVMLVYGNIAKSWKRALSIPETALAFMFVTALMVALAAVRLAWKARKKRIDYAPTPGTLATRTN
jgi:fucose 4-O-acetylase-like acetyltransferase